MQVLSRTQGRAVCPAFSFDQIKSDQDAGEAPTGNPMKVFSSTVEFNGLSADMENSLYTVLNVSLPPSEGNRGMVLFNLDLEGISASGGSACSSGASLGSHVLRALNSSPDRDAVRFSFSRYNTLEEIEYTVGKLKELFTVDA